MQRPHWNGRWRRWLILVGLLLSGCATAPGASSYRVTIPSLTISPSYHECWVLHGQAVQPMPCVELAEADYQALVIELKAACLALGQTPEECQAVKEQEK